MVLPS
jgi:hypothetical protein